MLSKKKIIWVAVSVLAIGLVALGGWLWYVNRTNSSSQDDSNSSQNSGQSEITQDALDQITSLRAQGKFDEAQKLIESQGAYNDGSFNSILYAQILADKGDVEGALRVLANAEEGSDQAYWYRGHAAKILYDAGDLNTAKKYYQEAIDMAQEIEPSNEDERLILTSRIADYRWDLSEIETENG